jgi:uncharacterized membrane protein
MAEGAPVALGELASQNKVLLSENASEKLGLHAGDKLSLQTPKGNVDFDVRGVIVDYTSIEGAVLIDLRHYAQYWGDDSIDGAFIFVKGGENVETVASRIRGALGGVPSIFVTKTAAVQQQLLGSLRKTFGFARGIETVILLIALIGVGIWALLRSQSHHASEAVEVDATAPARAILAERFARGEISPEEYRERLDHLRA